MDFATLSLFVAALAGVVVLHIIFFGDDKF